MSLVTLDTDGSSQHLCCVCMVTTILALFLHASTNKSNVVLNIVIVGVKLKGNLVLGNEAGPFIKNNLSSH